MNFSLFSSDLNLQNVRPPLMPRTLSQNDLLRISNRNNSGHYDLVASAVLMCVLKYVSRPGHVQHATEFVCLFVCLFGFLTSSSTTRLYRGRAPRQERLTILPAATHETELGDHDFCLSRSHYTDTDPTCRERAATAGIEPGTSSPGVARSTAELPPPPPPPCD